MDEAQREGRELIDDSLLDGVDSPGADTLSDDGTIDGNDQMMDSALGSARHPGSYPTPRSRPRPRSLHELPSYHVEMPLLPYDQLQPMGPWTPGNLTPDGRPTGPPHLNLINSSLFHADQFERRSRSPGYTAAFDVAAEYGSDAARSSSRTPSRRHTMESSSMLGLPAPLPYSLGPGNSRPLVEPTHYPYPPDPRAGYFGLDDVRRFSIYPPPLMFGSEPPRRSIPSMPVPSFRDPIEPGQSFLRPNPDFSAFDADHEAIMATIPGSRNGSRHPSRSNSPHIPSMASRSALTGLLAPQGGYASSPLRPEGARRSSRERRSRERAEAQREAMRRALAEADIGHHLRPDLRRNISDRQMQLPLLPPETIERMAGTPLTPAEPMPDIRVEADHTPMDTDEDVTMSQ
jgi:hypothetical protein